MIKDKDSVLFFLSIEQYGMMFLVLTLLSDGNNLHLFL